VKVNIISTSFYFDLTLFDLRSDMLRIMQATVQSNLFTSNETLSFSNDKIGSGGRYAAPDPLLEIGVINGIRKILVPVNHGGPANDAWSRHCDPEMFDESLGVNQTWVEVIPPNQAVALPLTTRAAEDHQLTRNDDTVVYLDCYDFQRTYNELIHRGATFVAAPAKMPFGWLSMLEDGDGRRYVLGQWWLLRPEAKAWYQVRISVDHVAQAIGQLAIQEILFAPNEATKIICVTGAGGTVGGEVLKQLETAKTPFRAAYFSENKASAARSRGIDAVTIDYNRPETLEAAFRWCDKLFLLGPNVQNQTQLELNAVEAAKVAGVRHIVKLSALGADQEDFLLAKIHRPVERAIQPSGIAWTILRPNGYMQNVPRIQDFVASCRAALFNRSGV
jgi:NAD(P)H-binding